MSTVSFFEQLTSSVSLSMVTIISAAILAFILIYTVASRLFFSSTKSTLVKQNLAKDKKPKESNAKKQQAETTSANDKKKKKKTKKNVVVVPSSSSSSTQSEESEDEKTTLVTPPKKSTPTAGKKPVVSNESKKTVAPANGTKTLPGKQQQQPTPVRTDKVEVSTENNKQKQSKTGATSVNPTVVPSKQSTTGKADATIKVNATVSNKKQPAVVNTEVKRTPVADGEAGSDHEDEGQWVTLGTKQVNSRNRNKGKPETLNTTNQTSPSTLPKRNAVSEKRAIPIPSNSNTAPSTNTNELDIEPTITANNWIQNQEPIEICQLLPANENRYTANDNWWKQGLNKQQTFSVNDIGEWPEREEDEEYVQVKHIIPISNINKKLNEDEL